MDKIRTYSRYNIEAVTLLGKQIKLGRKQRKWTEAELAQRAGISVSTVKRLEKGDMTCAVGLMFEVAILVGVKLFSGDNFTIETWKERINDKIALLPKTIRSIQNELDDDF